MRYGLPPIDVYSDTKLKTPKRLADDGALCDIVAYNARHEAARQDASPPEGLATDWYCHNCSEVVPLNERCKICGKSESEPR